ncbi:MAG: YeeE/YedE family protein [Fluviicola sp.]|nr:YeeE/YedE family protein [Fluviicola sp.]
MSAIFQPWPWYVSGPLIALLMFTLLKFGKSFGMSSNLRTICTIGGAGKFADFFRFDWKSQRWNLLVLIGAILGGFIASEFLSTETVNMDLNPKTIAALKEKGFSDAGKAIVPKQLFGLEAISSLKGILILLIGGIMVGFGARWAGGCTSGHAISGLSNLQLPSLIAVIGFFAGGLLMTHFIFPFLF